MPTPNQKLLEHHNKSIPPQSYDSPELLVITCIDYRIDLQVPKKFAFIVRTAGADPRIVESNIAFVISSGIKSVALIGHTKCAMSNEPQTRASFSEGYHSTDLQDKDSGDINEYFNDKILPSMFQDLNKNLTDNRDYLQSMYPEVDVRAMIYDVDSHDLSLIG